MKEMRKNRTAHHSARSVKKELLHLVEKELAERMKNVGGTFLRNRMRSIEKTL